MGAGAPAADVAVPRGTRDQLYFPDAQGEDLDLETAKSSRTGRRRSARAHGRERC
jgi:hypothetical protein